MIDEVQALQAPDSLVRISPEIDVPLTPRVRRLLDTAAMRRLSGIRQLGLVSLVYPGATHSRLEHSLGVYRNALLFLQRLFPQAGTLPIDEVQAEAFVLAAFLHDVGHWPFCHLIEELQLPDVPRHEQRAVDLIAADEIGGLIEAEWQCSPAQVLRLLSPPPATTTEDDDAENRGWRLLASLLSGPIDVDKMDYLVRDSLHAGVPYGRNFDANRLIGSLCVHPSEPRLAVTEKGRTAAEMMVFARYVMFSEVYWHHTVRSATAMLQRGLFLLRDRLDLRAVYNLSDADWIGRLRRSAAGSLAEPLIEGVFGSRRQLWKRASEFNLQERPDLHALLAQRDYAWLAACSEQIAARLSPYVRMPLGAGDVVIDASPTRLDVDIDVDVVARDGQVRSLGDVSPVVDALAHRQFGDFVKRIRVFLRPDVRAAIPERGLTDRLLREAITATELERD